MRQFHWSWYLLESGCMQQSAAGSKFKPGLTKMQLFSPHMSPSIHWSSLSQSPSFSMHFALSVQHDQVSASLPPFQLDLHVLFRKLTQQSAWSANSVLLCIALQLFSPHRRGNSHSSLLSQSPSPTVHGFSMLQHVHPGLPVDGPVDQATSSLHPLQSQSCAQSSFFSVDDEMKWFSITIGKYFIFLTTYDNLPLCKVPQPLAKQRSFVNSNGMSVAVVGKRTGLIFSSLKSKEKSNFRIAKSFDIVELLNCVFLIISTTFLTYLKSVSTFYISNEAFSPRKIK